MVEEITPQEEEKKSERVEKRLGGGIKTVVYDIVVGPNGAAIFLTEKISGILKVIMMLDMNRNEIPYTVKIVPAEIPDYVILNDPSFKGFKTYHIKQMVIDPFGVPSTQTGSADYAEIVLDDKLEVRVEGAQAGTTVRLLVRYHNA